MYSVLSNNKRMSARNTHVHSTYIVASCRVAYMYMYLCPRNDPSSLFSKAGVLWLTTYNYMYVTKLTPACVQLYTFSIEEGEVVFIILQQMKISIPIPTVQ